MISIFSYTDATEILIPQRSTTSPEEIAISEACDAIISQVKNGKDHALFALTKQFDQVVLKNFSIPITRLREAYDRSPDDLKAAIKLMRQRLLDFHTPQLQTGYTLSYPTKTLGQIAKPLDQVMVYVPGGSAVYLSTLLMNCIPAQIAGVKAIYVCTPPDRNGSVSDAVLCACYMAGLEHVYTLGGVQAIAAFAFGTESIPKVDKIVGPGNAYVAAAKKRLYGQVGIDMIAGPSEVLIVADSSANPNWIAADALAQLEHDRMAKAVVVSPDLDLLNQVKECLIKQQLTLTRSDITHAALYNNTALVHTQTLKEALDFANIFGPEHLGLAINNASDYLEMVQNAGAVFLGHYTPEAVGDYTAGSNHVLPTLGTARFQSPLGVYDFQKRINYVSYTKEALTSDLEAIAVLTRQEGLDAHRIATEIRLG